jgi:hypothetical protein
MSLIVSYFDLLPTELIAEIITHGLADESGNKKLNEINTKFYHIYNDVLCYMGITIIVTHHQMLHYINSQPNLIDGYFFICNGVWSYGQKVCYKSKNGKYNIKLTYCKATKSDLHEYITYIDDILSDHTSLTRYYPNPGNSSYLYVFVPGYQTIEDILMQHHLSFKSKFLKKSLFNTLNYYINAISADTSINESIKFKFFSELKEEFEFRTSTIAQ